MQQRADAMPADQGLPAGFIDAIDARPQPKSLQQLAAEQIVYLPKTATNYELLLMFGLMLMLASLAMLMLGQRHVVGSRQ